MPNLAGMFDMGPRPADTAAVVAKLEHVLSVPGMDYTVRSWRDERFGAVNLLTGICGNLDQPAADGNVVLFLDGEVTNLAETCSVDAVPGDAISSPARACLDLYVNHGDEFVRPLTGQFNILVYDSTERCVKVFNDRLAYRPFYYWCEDGVALFGLEKKALFAGLGRTPAFDPMGVLQFMSFGHNLDDRTAFSGVRAMPPGAVLQFKEGRAVATRYWKAAYARPSSRATVGEASEEFGRRLCRAVKRSTAIDRRYGIFLSGGLDSRAVAGALARTGRDVDSVTFGGDDSPDLQYGRQLAAQLGFAHHQLQYDETSFAEIMPRVVWRTEGSIPFNETLSIAHHRIVQEKSDVIFTGHFGDALSGGHLLPGQFLARDVPHLTEHIVAKRSMLHLSTLRSLFKPSFLNDAYPEMVRGIERSLVDLEEDRMPQACNLWDMTVRQTRFTFCSPSIDRYAFEPVTPFTDNEVVEWMLGMPVRHLFGQKIYKRMIVETFPEIADVPWARTGRPVPTSFALDIGDQAWKYAAKRLRRKPAPAAPAAVDNRVRDFAQFAAGTNAQDILPGDLFDGDAVSKAAQSALDGSWPATPLYLLMTLAECARLFGTGGLTVPPEDTRPMP